jgi:hypothetical protein
MADHYTPPICTLGLDFHRLDPDVETSHRIVQEARTYSPCAGAGGRPVGGRDSQVVLIIEDDGVGFVQSRDAGERPRPGVSAPAGARRRRLMREPAGQGDFRVPIAVAAGRVVDLRLRVASSPASVSSAAVVR